jgi:hypothetical protein
MPDPPFLPRKCGVPATGAPKRADRDMLSEGYARRDLSSAREELCVLDLALVNQDVRVRVRGDSEVTLSDERSNAPTASREGGGG